MLIPSPIVKNIVLGIISPHGSTDLIHASQNGLVPKLMQIQAVNIFTTQLLQRLNQDKILDVIFYLLSALHFRHDFITVKNYSKSILLFALFSLPEVVFMWFVVGIPKFSLNDVLLFYMTFLHVPNHYRMSWNFIKKQKRVTVFLVGLFSTLLLKFGNSVEFSNININIINIVKSFVISHIMYNEIYVHKSNSSLPEIVKYM